MRRRTVAAGAHSDLAGIGLGISDELRNVLNWKRWIYLHELRNADNARDGCGVMDKVEIECFE